MTDIYTPLISLIIILLFFVLTMELLSKPKSKKYRKVISDMFVVGRIRQLAVKHQIDIPAQLKDFKKYCKTKRIEEMPLDVSIEKDLQELTSLSAEDILES